MYGQKQLFFCITFDVRGRRSGEAVKGIAVSITRSQCSLRLASGGLSLLGIFSPSANN
jgi:hypothetical protein